MVCCDPTLPFLHCLSNPGSQGGWSFSQLSRVRGKVYMLNMLPVNRRLTHRHTHSHLQPIYNNKHIFSVTIFVKRTAFLLCSLKKNISFPEISNTYSFMNEHGFTKTTLCECRSMKESFLKFHLIFGCCCWTWKDQQQRLSGWPPHCRGLHRGEQESARLLLLSLRL